MDNLLIPIDIVVPEEGSRYFEECQRGFELAFEKVYEKKEINRTIHPSYHYWRNHDDDRVVKEVFSKDTNMVILALSSEQIHQLDNQLEEEQQCIAMAPLSSDPDLPTQINNLKNCFFLCPPCTEEAEALAQFLKIYQLNIEEGRIFGSPPESRYVEFFSHALKIEMGAKARKI